MKNILSSLLFCAAITMPAAYAQKPGDSVTPDALGKLEWVKGEAPTAWEPGNVYVLECWATWCGPCIAAIPHVDALYDKYKDQGLRVIGVNVWEDGKEKVVDFVTKKGDGMSYPVAYTGKGGPFETEWLKPAEVKGIPHAFIVKDGKVLAGIHPMKLKEDLVETLLKEGDAWKAAIEELNAEAAKDQKQAKAMGAFSAAAKTNDADAMSAAVEELKSVAPDNIYVPLMTNDVLIVRKEWDALETAVDKAVTDKIGQLILTSICNKVTNTTDVPEKTVTKILAAYAKIHGESPEAPYPLMTMSRLNWQIGDKEKATANAKKAAEVAKAAAAAAESATGDAAKAAAARNVNPEPFEKFAEAVTAGTMPTQDEFVSWMRAGLKARAEATKAEAKQ